MKKKRLSPIEEFLALSDEEKERICSEADQEFFLDKSRPLTPAQHRFWERIKRKKPGRPVKGRGHKVISVSVEKGLLAKADRAAKRRHMTRAALIADGLERVLAEAV